ncbi:MAG TPA: spore protease YyaC [Clostridiales bacterium]|nr:spore protease YyaC [Clostridiales bacterium]
MNKGSTIDQKVYYFDSNEYYSVYDFSKNLYELIIKNKAHDKPIVFLCIGTDRATGDCLGPIVGYKLMKTYRKKMLLYGTLNQPVHAQNLSETIENIYGEHPNAFIVAIDASLGSSPHIGFVTLGEGPLLPGAGVSKNLPSVGDIFITGIVNFSGVLDSMLLQTTRLNIVMTLADFICSGIHHCYRKLNN